VNPREAFAYSEGALHAAQAVGVVSGQVDIASDYDRHLDVLAAAGRIDRGKLKVLWQAELPNDPIVLRGGLPADVKDRLQKLLVQMSAEQARQLLPTDYTGFIPSDGSNYVTIEASGRALGKLK
jgi:phosphonate transport system substrate-binding protein